MQQNDISVKIIKANRDIFLEFIMHNFNEGIISTARFPGILKSAEVKPVFKKKSRIDKKNYRIFKQRITFFEPVFSKYESGFQKDHSA